MGNPCNSCYQALQARYVLCLGFFLGMINAYIMRNNISTAIVAMVNSTGETADRYADECGSGNQSSEENLVDNEGEFFWDSRLQGLILGAFYYGYCIPQILGGWLEQKLGGRIMFGLSMFLAAVLSILTPVASYASPWLLFTVRFLLGFVQGVIFPVHHSMWGRWSPPLERSKLMSITMSGTSVGSVIASIFTGVVSASIGWTYVFYLTGIFTLVWLVLWVFTAYSTPLEHPYISDKEKDHIQNSIGSNSQIMDMKSVPWKSIFTSIQLFGLVIGHFCANWGSYTLLTSLPIYMSQVLGFDLAANGFFSALPNIGLWLVTMLSGWIADLLRKHDLVSTINVRRSLTVLGMYFPAIFIVAAGFIGCNNALSIAMITISASFSGCSVGGFKVNHIEIAPRFGGILFGITNTVASFSGFMAPWVVGLVTASGNTREQWRIVFIISGIIYVFGGTLVLLTLKVEEQPWAMSGDKKIYSEPQEYDNNISLENFSNIDKSGSEDKNKN